MVACAILAATKSIFVKIAYGYNVGPSEVLGLRMLFSLPVFLGVAVWSLRWSSFQRPSRRDWWQILFIGFIGYYLASLLDLMGLTYISASLETVVLFLYPTMVALISVVLYGERIAWHGWLAVVVSYLGICFAFLGDVDIQDERDLLAGGALVFASAMAMAIYTIASARIMRRIGSVQLTSISMSLSAVFVAVHLLAIESRETIFTLDGEAYRIIALLALISTVLPCFLVLEGVRQMGASRASLVLCLSPVFTIVLANFWLGERMSPLQIFGSALVVVATTVFLVGRSGEISTDGHRPGG